MYITTFFTLKKVKDKKKSYDNNFLYLNKLDKSIKKRGINNLVIKRNKFKDLLDSFKDKKNKFKVKFKNIKFNNKESNTFENESILKRNKFNINCKYLYIIFFVLFLYIILHFISFFKFNHNILHFASNIYVSKNYDFNLRNFNSIYPAFNPSNYILNNKIINLEKEKTKDNKNENNYVFSDSKIDSIFNNKKEISVFKFNNNLNVNIKKASNRDVINFDNVKIFNYSSRNDIDFKELYNRNISLTKKSDKILLYNTHASESYKNSDKYKFEYTGTYRTRDEKYNMLAITKELQENLISKNINVIHNTTGHDYYKYTGSYLKSRESIKSEFKTHNNFGIIMDIHRDACGDLNYAPKINIGDKSVAQIMLVIGTGNSKNRNKYADDNISLAIKIQNIGEKIYPRII